MVTRLKPSAEVWFQGRNQLDFYFYMSDSELKERLVFWIFNEIRGFSSSELGLWLKLDAPPSGAAIRIRDFNFSRALRPREWLNYCLAGNLLLSLLAIGSSTTVGGTSGLL